jgi:hypothetical protein
MMELQHPGTRPALAIADHLFQPKQISLEKALEIFGRRFDLPMGKKFAHQ